MPPLYAALRQSQDFIFFHPQKGGRKGQLPPALYCLLAMADYNHQLYEPDNCLTIRQSGIYYLIHILPLSRRGHCTAGADYSQGIFDCGR